MKAHIDDLENKFEKKEKQRLRDEAKRLKKYEKLRNGGGVTEQTKPHYLSYGTSDIEAWPQKKEIESDSQNESALLDLGKILMDIEQSASSFEVRKDSKNTKT